MSNSSGQQSETTFEETYAAGADCCASEPTRRAIFHFTHIHTLIYEYLRREKKRRKKTIKENEVQSRPIGQLVRCEYSQTLNNMDSHRETFFFQEKSSMDRSSELEDLVKEQQFPIRISRTVWE